MTTVDTLSLDRVVLCTRFPPTTCIVTAMLWASAIRQHRSATVAVSAALLKAKSLIEVKVAADGLSTLFTLSRNHG